MREQPAMRSDVYLIYVALTVLACALYIFGMLSIDARFDRIDKALGIEQEAQDE